MGITFDCECPVENPALRFGFDLESPLGRQGSPLYSRAAGSSEDSVSQYRHVKFKAQL